MSRIHNFQAFRGEVSLVYLSLMERAEGQRALTRQEKFEKYTRRFRKIMVEMLATKRVSQEKISDLFGVLEDLFPDEMKRMSNNLKLPQRLGSHQKRLQPYLNSVDSYDIDLKRGFMVIRFDNGDVHTLRLGSLREITKRSLEIKEDHPDFFFAMGFLVAHGIDSILLWKGVEDYLDSYSGGF